MLHQDWIQLLPVASGDSRPELARGLLESLGPHDPKAVHDPVDVRVHWKGGFLKAEDEDCPRRLWPHTRKGQ